MLEFSVILFLPILFEFPCPCSFLSVFEKSWKQEKAKLNLRSLEVKLSHTQSPKPGAGISHFRIGEHRLALISWFFSTLIPFGGIREVILCGKSYSGKSPLFMKATFPRPNYAFPLPHMLKKINNNKGLIAEAQKSNFLVLRCKLGFFKKWKYMYI